MSDYDLTEIEHILEGGKDLKPDAKIEEPNEAQRESPRSSRSAARSSERRGRSKKDDKSSGSKKTRHWEEGSRSASRDRHRSRRKDSRRRSSKPRSHSKPRSRDRDLENRKRRRSRSKTPDVPTPEPEPFFDPIKAEEQKAVEAQEKRRKEVDEAQRDDLTVLVLNLSLKAGERDVWRFFSQHAGKVRDIQVIRDSRSGKSKGVGYVEFFTQDAVLKALSLSGQFIAGQPIRVHASQAEKNRAARAAKVQQQALEAADTGPLRIYVGGLVDSLSLVSEEELRKLFLPFGAITHIDMHRDQATGRAKGYAFLEFSRSADAQSAITSMNGFDIAGRSLKVGYASDSVGRPGMLSMEGQDSERLDDDGGGLLSGGATRLALMQKLQRGDSSLNPVPHKSSTGANSTPVANIPQANAPTQTAATKSVVLTNMYQRVEAVSQPGFVDEIVDDVRSECETFGRVTTVWADKDTLDGKVWIRFSNVDEAMTAFQKLNGRFFNGHAIKLEFVGEEKWRQEVPK